MLRGLYPLNPFFMANVPTKYSYLMAADVPKLVQEALKDFGVVETNGGADNPQIIAWADEVGAACKGVSKYAGWAADFYNDDAIPWCGLAMAVWAARSAGGRRERLPTHSYLSALAWSAWGTPQKKEDGMLGDVLVFVRKGGGHVGIYVGEDDTHFHVLGGNQSDCVCVTRLEKKRIYAIRRPAYNVQPASVRKIKLAGGGAVSSNEQ